MKKIQLIGMVMICLTMTMVSCSGDDGKDGLPGKDGINGTNGQDGVDGADGQDGADGAAGADGQDKPNVDFYFQDGFKGYDGTADASITSDGAGINENELQLYYSFNGLAIGERRSILRFDGFENTIASELVNDGNVCDDSFYVNKATLYVYISSYTNQSFENLFLKVGVYGDQDPIFIEEEVNWSMANSNDDWGDIGGESEQWADPIGSDDYPFLLPKGSGSAYGWFPIVLPRSVVKKWICNPNSNRGIRIRLDPNTDVQGNGSLNIIASENSLEDLRPLLIIETEKIDTQSAKNSFNNEENDIKNMTYEEKMAPLFKFLELKNQ